MIDSFFTTIPLMPFLSLNQTGIAPVEETGYDRQQFWIRLPNTSARREKKALLSNPVYARKDYPHDNIIRAIPHTNPLLVSNREGEVIGTVTEDMSSPEEGLLAEENSAQEVKELRERGKRICELNGLAADAGTNSNLVIAKLSHMALLYSWDLFDYTDGIVEVSPSHTRFYKNMRGFDQIRAERVYPRVNTIGILLHVDFFEADKWISRVGAHREKAVGNSSRYLYGFTKVDSDGMDFFAFSTRRSIFDACHKLEIPATRTAPMGAALVNFIPGKMSFEGYFCWRILSDEEKGFRCLLELAPTLFPARLSDRPHRSEPRRAPGTSTLMIARRGLEQL